MSKGGEGSEGAKGAKRDQRGAKGVKGAKGFLYLVMKGSHQFWAQKVWIRQIVLRCPHHLQVQSSPYLHSWNGKRPL